MICPNCQSENDSSLKFCENCGTPLPQPAVQDPYPGTTEPIANDGQQAYEATQQAYDPYAGSQQGYNQYGDYQQGYDPYGTTQQFGQQPQATGPATQPGAYTTANTPSNAPFVLAIIALVCTLFMLLPVSIILAIIALVMNSGQKRRGEISTKQTPTTVMSVISLVLSSIALIAIIAFGAIVGVAAVESLGEVGAHAVVKDGEVTIVVDDASSSSSAAAASSSSASSSTSTASEAEIVGTWKLVEANGSGMEVTEDDLELLEGLDMSVTLTAEADGTARLELLGESLVGSWTGISGTFYVELDDDWTTATVEGDRLTMSETGSSLVFERL